MRISANNLRNSTKVCEAFALKHMPFKLALTLHSKSVQIQNPAWMRRLQQINQGQCSDGRSLKPFDEQKAIFIHVPKTGGTSIKNAIFNSKCGGHLTLNDYALIMPPEKLSNYFKFCFVRNPWDRLVSAYIYLCQGGNNPRDKDFYETHIARFKNFNDFVIHWLNEKNIFKYVHFMPQTRFITHKYGLVEPDLIARYENLEFEFQRLAINFGITSRIPHSNRSKRNDFRTYYTDETREIVSKVYAKDIAYLNYVFE